jgi:hypothetical protein
MLTWQGLEKTCIGIYFNDQIWVIKSEYLGWSTLKSNYYQTLIDFDFFFFFFFFSYGSICCILQRSCLQIWILFTQEYVMAFWMKTITKSTRFCWSLYIHCSIQNLSFMAPSQIMNIDQLEEINGTILLHKNCSIGVMELFGDIYHCFS